MVAHAVPHCGTERQPVKTGTDPDAHKIDLDTAEVVNIRWLMDLPRPPELGDRSRAWAESKLWAIEGDVLAYKLEADSDVHVILAAPWNHDLTMIAEFPSPACVKGSVAESAITSARATLLALLPFPPSKQLRWLSVPLPLKLIGPGFFDKLHGQSGAAPNGIELHWVQRVELR